VLIVAEAWIVNDVVSEEAQHFHPTSLSIEALRLYSYLSISATFALFFLLPMLDYLSITSFPIHQAFVPCRHFHVPQHLPLYLVFAPLHIPPAFVATSCVHDTLCILL